jgi:hypothetical protein
VEDRLRLVACSFIPASGSGSGSFSAPGGNMAMVSAARKHEGPGKAPAPVLRAVTTYASGSTSSCLLSTTASYPGT